ncbi:MAG TPA: STAS domain-containing protein [Nevskiaceae bacterium]|nr:STAS domain-containing protein [Nevskiaceae bacterium]
MTAEVFVLPALLGMEQAASLKQDLVSLAAMSGAIELDGSAVQQIATAPLQLLAAFARERQSRAAPMRWRGVSDPLHSAATTLGVTDALQLQART